MSFFTGTQAELLYSWAGAGAALTGTVTQTSLNPAVATQPGPKIPAQLPGTPLYRSFRIVARGIMTTASTAVSFTVQPFKGLTDGALTNALYPAAGSIGGWPAITPTGSLTGLRWELEIDAILTAMGTSGTMDVSGAASWATAATTGASIPVGGVTASAVAINTTVDNFISIAGTLGGTTASNTLTMTQLKLYGEN
jgi:hypothetical protein